MRLGSHAADSDGLCALFEADPLCRQDDLFADHAVLDIEGGVWKFRLRSWVRFEERADRWIHYLIVGGHFTGLEGDIYFESAGEKGTLVYFHGDQQGKHWPPKLVIERGAEIVFGFTAGRMRKYLESNEDTKDKDKPTDNQ